MLRATKNIMLPTTITGSLPRPSWYTQNLGSRSFLDAMVNNQFREQYVDAVAIYLHEQEMAGLDIVTDGDAHFDSDVGGQSWTNYPPRHMGGFDHNPQPTPAGKGGLAFPPGHILHDYLESRVMPGISGPVTRGDLQYAAMFKVAQRMTKKPVKFGTIGPELVAFAVQDKHYKSIRDRILAITDALNAELLDLADAGCQVIQFEEPQVHLLAVRNIVDDVINPAFSVEVFNRTVKGLRAKTEVWCHTCWGNPSQQRMFKDVQSYKSALEMLNKVDADVITFESASAGGMDLEAFGKIITEKKICIGVIDHHSLQVERPEEIAEHIRRALKYIPAERLVLSSDCGMGREGMSRRHAYYKIVSMVLGVNMVRKELGLPQAECLAADSRYSLVVAGK
ncbi:MAG TPA: cobalamin-independent methionine synthase II family protein [Pseudolabrys sp.]|nr:cobalamin-independent methionine synthase II family protein [Pseudolabrys sp.]HXZ21296.1 cobalamin-independent methionine synthase II family protein [Pseudolabrys sp.]